MGVCLLLATLIVIGVPAGTYAQSVDEIIAKNAAARGGAEKMRAIHSIVVTARLTTPEGGGGPLIVRLLRPDHIREEMAIGGAKSVRSFDGTAAWTEHQDAAKVEIKPLSGGELDNLHDEAEDGIDGALLDYRAKGNRVELQGKEDVDGRPCYKLKVTLRTGHLQYQYLDARTFLEVREEIVRSGPQGDFVIEETVGDHHEEGGVLFPHRYVSGLKGRAAKSTLTIEKIELNPPMDEAIFHMPKR